MGALLLSDGSFGPLGELQLLKLSMVVAGGVDPGKDQLSGFSGGGVEPFTGDTPEGPKFDDELRSLFLVFPLTF